MNNPLSSELLQRMNAYWRAANYLSVGQIYLYDNPLLKEPLKLEHVKPRLLGHWGTTPGLNFIYVHLNRIINDHDLSVLYVTGPGHGGPGIVANTYLEGTYSELYGFLVLGIWTLSSHSQIVSIKPGELQVIEECMYSKSHLHAKAAF